MFITSRLLRASLLALTLLVCASQPLSAAERLCDTAFEDCRAPLINLIRAETVGLDVAWWFMEDSRYATEIIKRWQAGVPVRILIDPRANNTYPLNTEMLQRVQDAGIPMRKKLRDGIVHWKMMLFDGQRKVQFSSANYSPDAFVPGVPYKDYIDEVIYFSDDPAVVDSFRTKYDDIWTNTTDYGNHANIPTGTMLNRRYATFPINPELLFTPGSKSFASRSASAYRAENQKIDVIIYRVTEEIHANEMIAAVKRGVPVRLMHEPAQYRSEQYLWDSYNIDRMYMGGVQIKMRKHLGLNHEKATILYGQGMTVFGSSNWTSASSNSQLEHNYFTKKSWIFDWFVNHFERKWNSAEEYVPFVPLAPNKPTNISPASAATDQPGTVTLRWQGGPFAHKYDIYFGTTPSPPLLASDVTTGAPTGTIVETYTVQAPSAGTTYYWRVVGKTMANKTANGPTWSFTTSGANPTPTPTPTKPPPTPTPAPTTPPPVLPAAPGTLKATAASLSQITLSWADNSNNEAGFKIERSTDGTTFTQITTLGPNVASYANSGLEAAKTYYYRVRAYNAAGHSGFSNTASAQTLPQPPTSILFSDDFNDNLRDVTKWNVNSLEAAATDPAVAVREQNQRLEITALLNATGSHSNGYSSVKRFDLTNRRAAIEAVKITNTSSAANTFFLLINGRNWLRFNTEAGNLFMQQSVGGVSTSASVPYSATQHRHWRIRHNSSTNEIFWETSADGNAWAVQRKAAVGFAINALRVELYVRTWRAEASPGMAIFDNFRWDSN